MVFRDRFEPDTSEFSQPSVTTWRRPFTDAYYSSSNNSIYSLDDFLKNTRVRKGYVAKTF